MKSKYEKSIDYILKTEIGRDEAGIWWIGQAGYVFKTSKGKILFIDPYLSDSVARILPDFKRRYPPPVLPEDIVCDAVLCTHDHGDHLDEETIIRIKNKKRIKFIGPESCCRHYGRLGIPDSGIIRVNCSQEVEVDEIRIRGVFTIPLDEETIDGIGYIITLPNGIKVYHSGDTGYCSFLEYIKKYGIDIALVCINGKYKNMDCKEAALLSSQIGAKLAIPNHYDMFSKNMEDPFKFVKELDRIDSGIECRVLDVMETCIFKNMLENISREHGAITR